VSNRAAIDTYHKLYFMFIFYFILLSAFVGQHTEFKTVNTNAKINNNKKIRSDHCVGKNIKV